MRPVVLLYCAYGPPTAIAAVPSLRPQDIWRVAVACGTQKETGRGLLIRLKIFSATQTALAVTWFVLLWALEKPLAGEQINVLGWRWSVLAVLILHKFAHTSLSGSHIRPRYYCRFRLHRFLLYTDTDANSIGRCVIAYYRCLKVA